MSKTVNDIQNWLLFLICCLVHAQKGVRKQNTSSFIVSYTLRGESITYGYSITAPFCAYPRGYTVFPRLPKLICMNLRNSPSARGWHARSEIFNLYRYCEVTCIYVFSIISLLVTWNTQTYDSHNTEHVIGHTLFSNKIYKISWAICDSLFTFHFLSGQFLFVKFAGNRVYIATLRDSYSRIRAFTITS